MESEVNPRDNVRITTLSQVNDQYHLREMSVVMSIEAAKLTRTRDYTIKEAYCKEFGNSKLLINFDESSGAPIPFRIKTCEFLNEMTQEIAFMLDEGDVTFKDFRSFQDNGDWKAGFNFSINPKAKATVAGIEGVSITTRNEDGSFSQGITNVMVAIGAGNPQNNRLSVKYKYN
ncbi:MAG: hypothetical protein ACTSUE_05665, partial [Promethearchaeota archaeon]